jgi:hypothetical protein
MRDDVMHQRGRLAASLTVDDAFAERVLSDERLALASPLAVVSTFAGWRASAIMVRLALACSPGLAWAHHA